MNGHQNQMLDIKQTVNNTHGVDKLRIVNKISKMEPSFCYFKFKMFCFHKYFSLFCFVCFPLFFFVKTHI